MDEARVRGSTENDDISVFEVLSVFVRNRKTILGWTVGVAVLVIAVVVLSPRTYTAQASFFPQEAEASRLGGAAALASQFGISVSAVEAGHSPEFYAGLLHSREVLAQVLADTFSVVESRWLDTLRLSGTLAELLELDGETEALRRAQGIEWLREEAVRARTNQETGLVELQVTTPWPAVSSRIADRLLELVNDFNLQQRQSQARAERTFVKERLEEAQEELLRAEGGLKRFLENNRAFQNSPELRFEHDRLQRQVAMRQEIFTSLAQSYEEARISEVRNTPVITVVEHPEIPPKPDRRRLALKGLIGLLAGGMVGVFYAMGRELLWQSRGDEEYRRFQRVWREAVDEVRRPFQRLFRGR